LPLSKAEGLLLSNDELLGGLLENVTRRHQLAPLLPFSCIHGDSLRIARADAADFGPLPDFDTVPLASLPDGTATPTGDVSFELKMLTQDVATTLYAKENLSAVNDQAALQIQAALRRMMYEFWSAFYSGDSSIDPAEFDGVRKLIPAGRTLLPKDAINHYLTLNDLARLTSLVAAGGGRPDFILTSDLGYRNIHQACLDAGVEPESVSVPDGAGGDRQTLAFGGIPVLVDEGIPTNESVSTISDYTTAVVGKFGRDGLCGLTLAAPDGNMVRVRERLHATESTLITRLNWPVGLATKTEDALARIQFRPQPSTT